MTDRDTASARLGCAAVALLLAVLILGLVAACDTATPRDRCPAPWEIDACPDSVRVPF